MFETYKPSGRFGVSILPWFLGASVLVVLVSWLYQFLLYWVPLIYVNFLLTVGFGFGIGFIAAFIVNLGHVRSAMIGGLIGLLLCCVGLGGKFWFQYETLLNEATTARMEDQNVPESQRAEVKRELRKQLTFAEHIKLRTTQGWNIGRAGRNGAPIAGIFVYIVWLVEAGLVIGIAVLAASSAGGEPYSEELGKWASEEETVMVLPITSETMVAKIKAATAIEELLEIPIPETDQSHQFAVYNVNSIEGEEMEDAYLTVTLTTVTFNDKGEEEKTEEPLVKHAILSAANRAKLVDNASLLQEAMSDYRVAMNQKLLGDGPPEETKKPDDDLPPIPLD